jgi:hypothetical protein
MSAVNSSDPASKSGKSYKRLQCGRQRIVAVFWASRQADGLINSVAEQKEEEQEESQWQFRGGGGYSRDEWREKWPG